MGAKWKPPGRTVVPQGAGESRQARAAKPIPMPMHHHQDGSMPSLAVVDEGSMKRRSAPLSDITMAEDVPEKARNTKLDMNNAR